MYELCDYLDITFPPSSLRVHRHVLNLGEKLQTSQTIYWYAFQELENNGMSYFGCSTEAPFVSTFIFFISSGYTGELYYLWYRYYHYREGTICNPEHPDQQTVRPMN